MIQVQGHHITGKIKKRLKHILLSVPAKDYISSKKIIGKGSAPLVHWTALADSLRTTFHRNIQISKWVCDQLPNFKIQLRRKHATTNKCPFCKTETETWDHLLQCAHPTKVAQWEDLKATLHIWLQDNHTDPTLTSLIISMLTRWQDRTSKAPQFPVEDTVSVTIARDQHRI